jgi:hypothetical protein
VKRGNSLEPNFEDICVVILSRGRNDVLLRSLKYWAELEINVLVLHNTNISIPVKILGEKINYKISQESFSIRCGEAAKLLNHEYCIIASDDDFYLPTMLLKMARELYNNKLLSSIGAQTVSALKYGSKYYIKPTYGAMKHYSNLDRGVDDRIKNHFFSEESNTFNGAFYRMMRKNDAQFFLANLAKCSLISTPYIFEITAEIFFTLLGPSKYLSEVYWLRNLIDDPVQELDWNRKLYFINWYKNENYKYEVETWVKIIEELLINTDCKINLHNLLEKIMQIRFDKETREIFNSKSNFKKIKSLKIFGFLRNLKSSFKKFQPFDEVIKVLDKQGVTCDLKEFTYAWQILVE